MQHLRKMPSAHESRAYCRRTCAHRDASARHLPPRRRRLRGSIRQLLRERATQHPLALQRLARRCRLSLPAQDLASTVALLCGVTQRLHARRAPRNGGVQCVGGHGTGLSSCIQHCGGICTLVSHCQSSVQRRRTSTAALRSVSDLSLVVSLSSSTAFAEVSAVSTATCTRGNRLSEPATHRLQGKGCRQTSGQLRGGTCSRGEQVRDSASRLTCA